MSLLRASCLGRACGPFRILDVQAVGSDLGSLAALRVQLADRAILGFVWSDEARTWRLEGSRLRAHYREEGETRDVGAGWHGRRLDVSAGAHERDPFEGGGWQARAGIGYRTSAHLRLGLDVERDLQDEAPPILVPRPRTSLRLGGLWQPGPRLELAAGLAWARLRDGTGEDADRYGVDASLRWQASRFRLRAEARYDDRQGRFRRRDLFAGLGVDVRVASHLLLGGDLREAVEIGVGERLRSWEARLALHARRYRFPRAGETGAALEELARLAWRSGYGLSRTYDIVGLRALRERVRLTGEPFLEAAAEAVYRAQVTDRRVPLVDLRWEGARREDVGLRVDTGRAALALPWPPVAPWSTDEASTEFLRVEIAYTEARFGGVREIGRRYALGAALNRELMLEASWERPIRTPLELALGREPIRAFRAGLRYAWRR